MKRYLSFLMLFVFVAKAYCQNNMTDSSALARVTVQKDKRIDMLGEKMYEYNTGLAKNIRSGKGYRLMVLSTNDRNLAMALRSKLLQQFPSQKVYMIYQNPFIKVKMGNFEDKVEAENFKNILLRLNLTSGNIYLLPETIEIVPDAEQD
jgi:hypothetical protein